MTEKTSFQTTQRYQGGCHCGAVRFEVELDLSKPVSRCNCSICVKTGTTNTVVEPTKFELLSGMDALTDYQFNSLCTHHYFCKRCGIRSFTQGNLPQLGGDFYGVNVACLDDVDLDTLSLMYWDGKHNAWQKGPVRVDPPRAA